MTTAEFSVRTATPADAEVIAHHRAEMFRDIHSLSDELCVALEHASRTPPAHLLGAGAYLGWLASLGFVATNEMRFAGTPPLHPSA